MLHKHRLTRTLTLTAALTMLFGCGGPPPSAPNNTSATVAETAGPPPSTRQKSIPQPLRMQNDAVSTQALSAGRTVVAKKAASPLGTVVAREQAAYPTQPSWNRESYAAIGDNGFINAENDSLSTFSIDVDTASYANIRRFLQGGSLPPVGAVRIEEMVNYFHYNYPEPASGPFSLAGELGPCPWQPAHRLVRIGLKAKSMKSGAMPPSNLVFLIDVSGSMNQPNKLPLLKKSMRMLVSGMKGGDRVAIVAYAGSDRVVLPPTPGDHEKAIDQAIDALTAGGSTYASGGIQTAYRLAARSYMPGGNNRVILASDGDFNVGVTSRGELKKLITEKRKSGIYLTVLGFGMGNYHDDTMETLADAGNGDYAYIDSLLEAQKVLLRERAGTLFTLARDVKLQVEFNPAVVGAYRLLGYANRMLADEDFANDKKDAGEIGLGHTVTALYELIPAGAGDIPAVPHLKYRKAQRPAGPTEEVLTVKLRYTPIHDKNARVITTSLQNSDRSLGQTSDDFRFSAAVAGFGMLLSDSAYKEKTTYPLLLELSRNSRGRDEHGYRAEFVRLVETADLLRR